MYEIFRTGLVVLDEGIPHDFIVNEGDGFVEVVDGFVEIDDGQLIVWRLFDLWQLAEAADGEHAIFLDFRIALLYDHYAFLQVEEADIIEIDGAGDGIFQHGTSDVHQQEGLVDLATASGEELVGDDGFDEFDAFLE